MIVEELLNEISHVQSTISMEFRIRMNEDILKLMKRLGVNDFDGFYDHLCSVTNYDQRILIADLLEIICRYREANAEETYYEIYMISGCDLGFYSSVRIRDGIETRIPRKVCGVSTASYLRKKGQVYVISTEDEAKIWMLRWGTAALVPCGIFDSFFLPLL